MFLTAAELLELTRKKRSDAQAAVLKALGIEHKVRPDGTVAVLKRHVEHLFGAPNEKTAHEREQAPDLSRYKKASSG